MKLRSVFIVLAPLCIIGCATKVAPLTKYSFDVYQYNLDKNDFAKLEKGIKQPLANPALITLSYDKYWNLVDHLEQESFFSIYKYSSTSCKINENGGLVNNTNQSCNYSYADKNLNINVTANNFKNNQVDYTIKLQNNNESIAKYNVKSNSSNQYFLFTYKNYTENLLFIIYRNELSIPWNEYKNSPQQYNSH